MRSEALVGSAAEDPVWGPISVEDHARLILQHGRSRKFGGAKLVYRLPTAGVLFEVRISCGILRIAPRDPDAVMGTPDRKPRHPLPAIGNAWDCMGFGLGVAVRAYRLMGHA